MTIYGNSGLPGGSNYPNIDYTAPDGLHIKLENVTDYSAEVWIQNDVELSGMTGWADVGMIQVALGGVTITSLERVDPGDHYQQDSSSGNSHEYTFAAGFLMWQGNTANNAPGGFGWMYNNGGWVRMCRVNYTMTDHGAANIELSASSSHKDTQGEVGFTTLDDTNYAVTYDTTVSWMSHDSSGTFITPGGNEAPTMRNVTMPVIGRSIQSFRATLQYKAVGSSTWVDFGSDAASALQDAYEQSGVITRDSPGPTSWTSTTNPSTFYLSLDGEYKVFFQGYYGNGTEANGLQETFDGNPVTTGDTVYGETNSPPTLTILGDNPYTLEWGTNFTTVDPGVTSSDPDGDTTTDGYSELSPDDPNTIHTALGSYTIRYAAEDGKGNNNYTYADRIVNVVESVAPSITLLGDNPQEINEGVAWSDPGYTVNDNYDPPSSVSVNVDDAPDDDPGEYTVTYTATDTNGNSTVVTRTVRVISLGSPPSISLNGSAAVYIATGYPWVDPGVTVSDAEDSADPTVDISPTSIDVNQIGQQTITYTATDDDLNTSSVSRQVNIYNDYSIAAAVSINSAGNFDFLIDFGYNIHHAHIAVTDTNDSANTTSKMVYRSSGASTGTGTETYVVPSSDLDPAHGSFSWRVWGVDGSHNSVTDDVEGTLTIAAPDATAPVITLLVNNAAAPGGDPTVTLGYGEPFEESVNGGYTATDDSGETVSVTVGGDYVNYTTPGTYTITYSATDSAGNTGTASRDVIILPMDRSLSATASLTNQNNVNAVISYGANISGWDFDVLDSNGSTRYGAADADAVSRYHLSPRTFTSGTVLTPGTYTWTLTGTDTNGGSVDGGSGTLSIAVPLDITTFAVTADARPWNMANVRWGVSPGVTIPSDMRVQVERKAGSDGSWVVLTSTALVDGGGLGTSTGTGFHDTGLTPDTVYYYRLILVDSNGTQGSYTAEMEYATIAVPTLTSVDVNTRGNRHPIVSVTGSGITHWYWTTESVTNPQDRTRADWEADSNANHVTNTSNGSTAATMSHLGDVGVADGVHVSGAYSVTVCGFYGDSIPLTSDMSDPTNTTNTVHVVPYNVYSGDIGTDLESGRHYLALDSDWKFRFNVSKPNNEFDWHEVRYLTSASAPTWTAGQSLTGQGTVTTGAVEHTVSETGPDTYSLYLYPVSDESDEAVTTPVVASVWTPKGVDSVTTTVLGDNLTDGKNLQITVASVNGMFSPGNTFRVGTTPPPSGNISNWGEEIASAIDLTFEVSIKAPGTGTIYAQACFADGTPIGQVKQDAFTIPQRAFTGLTDLVLVDSGQGIDVEAYGYFPQWRYYVGVLPYRTESGADMDADPNGTAVTEDVQTPDTDPSTVTISDINPEDRTVIIGVATDGQYLLGKPLIRVYQKTQRSPSEAALLKAGQSSATFDPDLFMVGGAFGRELDAQGNPKKIALTASTEGLSVRIASWASQGLTKDDFTNLMITSQGSVRPLEKVQPYLMPRVESLVTETIDPSTGTVTYSVDGVYPKWSTDDGTAHMGIDFATELANDFVNVDNAILTLVTNPNGIVTYDGIRSATATVDLTGSGTGTLMWPKEFVEERLGVLRGQGLIDKDYFEGLNFGKRHTGKKKADGSLLDSVVKRPDVKQLYPTAVFEDLEDVTFSSVEEKGIPKLSPAAQYNEGFVWPKFRSGPTEKVPAEDFLKKGPLIKIGVTIAPSTDSRHRAPSASVLDMACIDFVNDRPSSGLRASSPISGTFVEGIDYRTQMTAFAADYSGPGLTSHTKGAYPGLEEVLDVLAPEEDPEVPLFVQWHHKTTVPLEILSRHLHFGNATSQEKLQSLYDMEKTAVAEVPGTGRDRTEWKTTIVDFATALGLIINQ